jgi:iron complex outermembrane receptor protein
MEFRARHRINRWDYQTVYGEAIFNIETDWGFHQVLLGADYTRVDVDNNETSRNEVFMTNIFNPVVVPDPMIPVRDEKNIGSEDRTGLYVQDLISFGDKWSVLFGLRYDEFASDFSVAGTPSSSLETENVTPRAGIVFHPDENLSFYGSYSESFEPNNVVSGGFVNDGEQLDPTTGVQYEVGAKAELFDRKLLLSGAAFLAWRTDIPFEDREANRLLQRGEQRHKGIELTATGLVGEHLSLVGSVAFLNAEFTRDDNPALVGNTPSGVADFSASFWAEYQVLDGFLRNLSLQGGWFYEDDRPGDDNNTFVLSSYHRFDVGLKYAWELAEDRSLVLRLTVSNLFDEEYFKGDRRFEVNPERPREVRISGQISF